VSFCPASMPIIVSSRPLPDLGPMTPEQRRALRLLGEAGQRGITVALMLAHGFAAEMLTGLVRDGLAVTAAGRPRAHGRRPEVVRITDAGQAALNDRRRQPPRRSGDARLQKCEASARPPWAESHTGKTHRRPS
jgi:hypothetical protein